MRNSSGRSDSDRRSPAPASGNTYRSGSGARLGSANPGTTPRGAPTRSRRGHPGVAQRLRHLSEEVFPVRFQDGWTSHEHHVIPDPGPRGQSPPRLPEEAAGPVPRNGAAHVPCTDEPDSGITPRRPDVDDHARPGPAGPSLQRGTELRPPPQPAGAERPLASGGGVRGHVRSSRSGRGVRRTDSRAPWRDAGRGCDGRCGSSSVSGTRGSSCASCCSVDTSVSRGLEFCRQRPRGGRPVEYTVRSVEHRLEGGGGKKSVKNPLSPWQGRRRQRYNPRRLGASSTSLPLAGNPRFHNCG
jgi:hypothetical protein